MSLHRVFKAKKTVEQFPQWFQDQGYKDIPVLYDTKATTFQAYQIRSIPTEYLIDSQGRLERFNLVLSATRMQKQPLKK